MGKIISVVNQKGGVGKMTTAVNLGAYLAYLGKHVLLVDVDPQANATSGIGVDHRNLEHGIYEALIGEKTTFEIIKRTLQEGYKIAPATISLAGAGIEMVHMDEREFRLSNVLKEIKDEYDYIIIDGPPSGLLTINSLVAADKLDSRAKRDFALRGLASF